jgi:hypothetical protein
MPIGGETAASMFDRRADSQRGAGEWIRVMLAVDGGRGSFTDCLSRGAEMSCPEPMRLVWLEVPAEQVQRVYSGRVLGRHRSRQTLPQRSAPESRAPVPMGKCAQVDPFREEPR